MFESPQERKIEKKSKSDCAREILTEDRKRDRKKRERKKGKKEKTEEEKERRRWIESETRKNKFVYTKAQSRVIGQEQLCPKIMKKMKFWTFWTFLKI